MSGSQPRQKWLNGKNPFLWIFILFVISVLVRIPTLNRPLSKHHEYNTATALIILNSWKQEGIAHFKYCPVQLWPEKFTQTFYKNRDHPLADSNGNLYYTSFPPFGLYVPYFLFTILGIPFTALSLQILNLLFHFISAIILYKTIKLLLPLEKVFSETAALIGVAVYLLSPSAMWFQGNVFFPDVFYTNFLILSLYFTFRIFIHKQGTSFQNLLLYTISLAILTYTDWMGMFLGFFIFNYAIYRSFKQRKFLILLPLTVIAVALPVILTVNQYSSIHGLMVFAATAIGRFAERGFSTAGDLSFFESILKFFKRWRLIGFHYATGFLPIIILIGGLIIMTIKNIDWRKILKYKHLPLILITTFIPVLLHHIIFIKYSMFHDFSVLKAVIFLSIQAALLSYACRNLIPKKYFYPAIALVLISCIIQYYFINRPGSTSRNGDRYDAFKEIGMEIKTKASNDDVVFLNGIKGPQIIYYSGRNIFNVADEDGARMILDELDAEKGKLFWVEEQKVVRVEEVVR